jgi:hypothetical protein
MIMTITMRTRLLRPPSKDVLSHWQQPYHRAALAYATYGLVYLFGAWLQLTPDRQHDFHGVPWWFFFVVGAALIAVVPALIWRGYRRFTRIMSVFPAIKAMTLLFKQGKAMGADGPVSLYNWFFIAVALCASVVMFKAGMGQPVGSEE